MAKFVQDFLTTAGIVSALFAFFVFASHKWIVGVEDEVFHQRAELKQHQDEIVELKTLMREVRDALKEINRKLDRPRDH